MKVVALVPLLGLLPASFIFAASDSQTITLDHKLQIPGATLKSGQYTFEIEDRLQDRAIIRITDSKKNSHELVLAVPNEKLNQADHKIILFPTGNSDKQILQGWMCPSCQTALEVVYPKGEAVKITGESAKPVLAVDPTYDKLPKNLSPDDMKVVTLWLLSPKEVTADQKGKGLEAAKWADVNGSKTNEVAQNKSTVPAPSASPVPAEAPVSTQAAVSSPSTATSDVATTNREMPTAPQATPPIPVSAAAATSQVAASDTTASPTQYPASTRNLQASNEAPGQSTRRMPHTASNTFTYGAIGLLMLALGFGLQLQRYRQETASNR